MFEVLFWIIFFLIILHYLLFGIIVLIVSKFSRDKEPSPDYYPSLSIIIAAYNEEKILHKKIQNALDLDYPKNKIEIIIVTDGSSDNTSKIAAEYSNYDIISIHQDIRQGKSAALNRAVTIAKNEILIFSDANSFFQKDALKKLSRHFIQTDIGGVCGRKVVKINNERHASKGDNLYWIYESSLKQAESKLGSIPTADGEIFALRKYLYPKIPQSFINDDMYITFNIVLNKKRVIYDQDAITEEEASITLKDDFNVKSRMVYGGIQAIAQFKTLLNPLKSWFGLQFFFHKTLRYFMWALLILIFILNLHCLPCGDFYIIFFILQISFYTFAIIGYLLNLKNTSNLLFYLPYYYCNVNLAAFKGFLFFLKQKSINEIWTKAQR